ncbi:SCO family protein [Solibacillus sp. FSL H8-0538]|uniref:SCO family protein n=1 Tax=Solibacillus sp. FSL H8-0538 TaxID=2921400 RepID=UPI0030F5F36A
MRKKSVGLIVLMLMAIVLSACSNYQFKPTTSYEIQDFTVTDHRGEEVSLESLKGKPWLAMFIFTNCTTICSPMTYNMTEIQKELIDRDVEDYNIVAFSVDPANDTPEVLTEYLSRYTVPDESKWHLLTGYDQKFIEQFSVKSFKSLVRAIEGDDQVMHANTFFLVDEQGVAVKNYTGYSQTDDGVPFDTIAVDMESLIEERLGK